MGGWVITETAYDLTKGECLFKAPRLLEDAAKPFTHAPACHKRSSGAAQRRSSEAGRRLEERRHILAFMRSSAASVSVQTSLRPARKTMSAHARARTCAINQRLFGNDFFLPPCSNSSPTLFVKADVELIFF